MGAPGAGPSKTGAPRPARAVVVRVLRGEARGAEGRFTATFTVGRGRECDLQLLDPVVAPHHVQVLFDGARWWARNLAVNGTYLGGAEIQMMPLQGSAELEVGKGGPVLSLTVTQEARTAAQPAVEAAREERPGPPPSAARARTLPPAGGGDRGRTPPPFTSEDQILERLRAPRGAPAGKQTQLLRRAFAEVQQRSSRRYQLAIAAALVVLLGAGGVILLQQRKLAALRATAEQLFYATRAVEVQTARLEELVLARADPQVVAELRQRRASLQQMEREYDGFVRELGVYARATEEERLILRVARAFGECEVNVPAGFMAEVQRYVKRWQSTDRLATGLRKAREKGYAAAIARTFAASNLPPQYLFLALQESGFDERALGPPTRYGFAKGMWQFISPTGQRYGLRIGPRHAERAYDPEDERFEWQKATAAAARYIKELTATRAQGSGLLVMASYNWGEHNISGMIDKLPENPRDRNFWRLLADRSVPRETYDYVLSIFSAAVICEEPGVFGFGGECPGAETGPARTAGNGQ